MSGSGKHDKIEASGEVCFINEHLQSTPAPPDNQPVPVSVPALLSQQLTVMDLTLL